MKSLALIVTWNDENVHIAQISDQLCHKDHHNTSYNIIWPWY